MFFQPFLYFLCIYDSVDDLVWSLHAQVLLKLDRGIPVLLLTFYVYVLIFKNLKSANTKNVTYVCWILKYKYFISSNFCLVKFQLLCNNILAVSTHLGIKNNPTRIYCKICYFSPEFNCLRELFATPSIKYIFHKSDFINITIPCLV